MPLANWWQSWHAPIKTPECGFYLYSVSVKGYDAFIMKEIITFFLVALIAIFIENAVFSRALGTCRLLAIIKKPNLMFKFGLVLSITTTAGSALSWVANYFIGDYKYKYLLEPLLYILILSIVYFITGIILSKFANKVYEEIKKIIPLAIFNCATLGALLLPAHQAITNKITFASTIGFGFGSGIGFMLALVLVYEGQKAIESKDIPKDFQGLPIMLIYIGILSLAFYGLIGHQLPF